MIEGPCKDCVDRRVGCHDRCEKYKQFKIDREDNNKKLKEYKEKSSRQKVRVARVKDIRGNGVLKCHKKWGEVNE